MPRARWRTRILLPFVVVSAVLSLLFYASRESLQSGVEVRVLPVVATGFDATSEPGEAGSAAGSLSIQAPGWVEPAPYSLAVVALTEGVVEEVLALEGERVESGQVVARLVQADAMLDARAAEARLAEARALLQGAAAELTAAQQHWEEPVERRRAVSAAEAAVAESKAEREQLEAEIKAEEARVAELLDQVERSRRLAADSATSAGELSRLELRLKTGEATATAIRKRSEVQTAQSARLAAELAAATQNLNLRTDDRLALDSAKARLTGAEAALAVAQVAHDTAGLRLERTQVRSPAAGVVQARLIGPGSRIMLSGNTRDGDVVLRLYDPASLQVRVDVPLADAGRIGVGTPAEITTETAPDHIFRGKVVRLVHEANIQKNTLQAKVLIEELEPDQRELKPEMLARVRFTIAPPESGSAKAGAEGASPELRIPKAALANISGQEAVVWVVDRTTGRANRRTVSIGAERSDEWVVMEPNPAVRPGDRLIVAPFPPSLADGVKVQVLEESATKGESE